MDPRDLAAYEASAAAAADRQWQAERVIGDYVVLRVLGVGAFGRVVLAQRRSTGELAAIKLLPRGFYVRAYNTYVAREVLHHASLRHPFVIALREIILTEQSLAVVMEYASGGTLFEYMTARSCIDEAEARWLFQQLIVGLAYCHSRGVANRDIKLENLLLEGAAQGASCKWPLLKICDFGYSKHELNSTAKTGVGTPLYMAPEVIACSKKYDAKRADIWSCGVILYVLLFGGYPFNPESEQYARAIMAGQWSMPAGTGVSSEARHLLCSMMALDPLQRIDMAGILSHPWFVQDLPSGAAAMNAWYLANAPQLEPFVPVVGRMIRAAEAEGTPGEPPQVVTFEPATSAGGGGGGTGGSGE